MKNSRKRVQKRPKSENIYDYLEKLNSIEFTLLYSNCFSCLCVYKSFNDFGQYVIRTMLFLKDKLWSLEEIQSSLNTEDFQQTKKDFTKTMRRLFTLKILEKNTRSTKFSFSMCESFQKNLIKSLGKLPKVKFSDSGEYSVKKLEKCAKKRWEKILYVLVGTTNVRRSNYLIEILKNAGLIRIDDEKDGAIKITSKGFQFLLLDLKSQLWTLLEQYLVTKDNPFEKDSDGDKSSVDRIKKIIFLFTASYLEIGKAYEFDDFEESEQKMIRELRHFGVFKIESEYFYVTPLAREISATGQDVDSDRWKIPGLNGEIIVQTNFKFYLYSDNPIQIAILSLFSTLLFKTPNMVSGIITRDSIRTALINGVKPGQIVDYLYIHSHTKALALDRPLPLNVQNQIFLWAKERDRMAHTPGLLFDSFSDVESFRKVVRIVSERKWLLWYNEDKKWLVVKDDKSQKVEENMKMIIRKVASGGAKSD